MFEALHSDHADFSSVTDFVHESFKRSYGADVQKFMPNFIRVNDKSGSLKAVVGYREAAQGQLYLEKYMDEPIEAAISRYLGESIKRSEIVEVGNMAEVKPGDARMAIIGATSYLHTAGYRWVVFTGVTRLRNAFRRLGLNPKELMEVDEYRLPDLERQSWGTYFNGDPVVCFGSIREGYENLQELWVNLRDTWAVAEEEGQQLVRDRENNS